MPRCCLPITSLILLLLPWTAAGGPAFPAVTGAEVAWPDGPEGAFRPVQPVAGTTYYVDAATGSDATGTGSEGDPVETIARALELISGGDTIVVRTGVYSEQIRPPDLTPSSTRSRPVTLRADPGDGVSVVIDGAGVVPVVEGSLQNSAGVSLYNDAAYTVEGFLIQNWSGYGLAVQQSNDAVVRGCTFRDNGTEMADSVDAVVISSRDVWVQGSTFDSATERGLDDRSTDTTVIGNLFSGHTSNAVKVGPYPAGLGSRVLHNTFFDNPSAQGVVYVHGAQGVTIQRNLVVRGSLQGIRIDEAEDTLVVLNTVVGFRTGLELYRLFGSRVEGNIVATNTLGMELLSLMPADVIIDGNLYHDNTVDVEQGDPGPNAIFADPAFNDPGADKYSLGAGSPAEDAGPDDLPVPEGGGARVDRGAFETGAAEPPWHYQTAGQVADLSPRFLWTYVHREDVPQDSYRVQVDSVPSFDSEDLVDSNWQQTTETAWTMPRDFALAAGEWYVRVKVQDDNHDQSPWSDPHLRLGLTQPPTCASQGGISCDRLDDCDGTWLEASDDPRCCQGACVACPDADSDGFVDIDCGGLDCDDADPGTNPDAEEVCDDDKDNDCDLLTDGADSDCGCVDHDRDGYGENCEAGEDCDDGIASVHPGATEVCNNVDDNCDGLTDEGFDTQLDPDNCGECGYVCRSHEVCDLGACKTECGGDRTDCERSCRDTQTDLENCGGCGTVCDVPNAGEKCEGGVCALTACEAGWVDLNADPADGCEYECTPALEETCDNGIDDDCDGSTDEDCDGGGGGCGCGATGAKAVLPALMLLLAGLRRRWY